MAESLMEIYFAQTNDGYFAAHTDHHSDSDSYDGSSGNHTEYDSHSDSDDDYSDRW